MTLKQLSFTKLRDNGTVDAWAVEPTGDYAADCETGKACFSELMQMCDNPLAVSHVMQAIVERGRMSGLEVGFLHALSFHVSAS